MIIAIILFFGVIAYGIISIVKSHLDGEKMINDLHNSHAAQREQNDKDLKLWMYGDEKNEKI